MEGEGGTGGVIVIHFIATLTNEVLNKLCKCTTTVAIARVHILIPRFQSVI